MTSCESANQLMPFQATILEPQIYKHNNGVRIVSRSDYPSHFLHLTSYHNSTREIRHMQMITSLSSRNVDHVCPGTLLTKREVKYKKSHKTDCNTNNKKTCKDAPLKLGDIKIRNRKSFGINRFSLSRFSTLPPSGTNRKNSLYRHPQPKYST